MDKTMYDLLLRSFDGSLNKSEQSLLDESLALSEELEVTKQEIAQLRKAYALTKIHPSNHSLQSVSFSGLLTYKNSTLIGLSWCFAELPLLVSFLPRCSPAIMYPIINLSTSNPCWGYPSRHLKMFLH